MSLEQTLDKTNELLQSIITILQTGVSAGAEVAGDTATKTERKSRTKKEDTAAATGDFPRYFVIEKHNTVYEQKSAAETGPSIEGTTQVTKEVYDAKKAQFAALVNSVAQTAPSSPTAEVAAGGAQGQSTARQAGGSSTATDAAANSASEVSFQDVIAKMTELNTSTLPGHGRDGVMAVLKKFLPGVEKPTAPALAPLGKNAEILAHVESLLKPAAETEYDPLG